LCLVRFHKLQSNSWFSESRLKEESKELFNHSLKLSKYPGPVLILHTADDTLVKVDHAITNYKACGGQITTEEEEKLRATGGILKHNNKKLVIFEKGGHNYIYPANSLPYREAVTEFFKHHN